MTQDEIVVNRLTFAERNELSNAYNRWLLETNEEHKNEFELKDNALQVINFLDSKGFFRVQEVKEYVAPTMRK